MSIDCFIYENPSEASAACAVKIAELLEQAQAERAREAFAISVGTIRAEATKDAGSRFRRGT